MTAVDWTYVTADPEASGDIGHWSASVGERYALIFPAMVPELTMPYGVELDMETADLAVEVEPALAHWTVGIRNSGSRVQGSALTDDDAKRNAEIVLTRWAANHIYNHGDFDVVEAMA